MHIHYEIIQPNYTIKKLHKEWGFAHWHQRMELAYVVQGRCEIKIGNKTRIYAPGDLAVIHSGEVHAISDVEESIIYICTFDSQILYQFCSDVKYICNYISADMLAHAGIQEEILKCFEGMFQENSKQDDWSGILLLSNILRLYGLLVRHFEWEPDEQPKNIAKLQRFQETLHYIEENYADNITLEDVAKTINYNPTYVSTLFVAYTGLNFKSYLDSFRINQAVKLMKSNDMTIADISAQCGFANIRTFNNVFRKITGMTPSQLRKTNI